MAQQWVRSQLPCWRNMQTAIVYNSKLIEEIRDKEKLDTSLSQERWHPNKDSFLGIIVRIMQLDMFQKHKVGTCQIIFRRRKIVRDCFLVLPWWRTWLTAANLNKAIIWPLFGVRRVWYNMLKLHHTQNTSKKRRRLVLHGSWMCNLTLYKRARYRVESDHSTDGGVVIWVTYSQDCHVVTVLDPATETFHLISIAIANRVCGAPAACLLRF